MTILTPFHIVLFVFFLFSTISSFGQATYHLSRLTLTNMLEGSTPLNLRQAVYSVENAYLNNNLDKAAFNNQIDLYAGFCRGIMQSGDIRYEGNGDEQNAKAQCAVFVFMTDSVPLQVAN